MHAPINKQINKTSTPTNKQAHIHTQTKIHKQINKQATTKRRHKTQSTNKQAHTHKQTNERTDGQTN